MVHAKARIASLITAGKLFNEDALPDDLEYYERDLGLAIQLADERLRGPFMLPPMGNIINNNITIGTGTSRLAAELMCATPPEEISFIIYVANDTPADLTKFFNQSIELSSTSEYEKLLNINDIDYRVKLDLSKSGTPEFTNSIISHSVYDYSTNDEASNFTNIARSLLNKLKGASNEDGQVVIEIRCTQASAKFIPQSNEYYKINIEIQPDEEWHWSYGRFLGLTNSSEVRETGPKIYILLYDISETLNLDLVSIWLGNTSVYQTRNKKIAVFTPGRIGSIKEVEKFVK